MIALALTVVLAAALWGVMFGLKIGNFWVNMTLSASLLSAIALGVQRKEYPRLFRFGASHVAVGIASAAVLYAAFVLGDRIAAALFPFAPAQVEGIYGMKSQMSPALVGILLVCVIGPAEEIYWRGFLQDRLQARLGGFGGWLVGGLIYGAVHLWAANFMLFMAALIAGMFWGLVYWRQKSLWPGIISHSLWDLAIFILLPVR